MMNINICKISKIDAMLSELSMCIWGSYVDIRELNYIYTIAKCGSISKAAKEIHMAQSSLSQFLKNFELRFGEPLFIRTSQGLKATYAGELYTDMIHKIYMLQRDMEQRLYDTSHLLEGRVVFAISPYRAPYLLPETLPKFKEQYPGIKVEIIEASMREQEELILSGKADLGFLSPPLTHTDITLEPIIEEEILLAGHERFCLIDKAHTRGSDNEMLWIDIRDVASEPHLLYSVDHRLRSFSERLFDDYQCEPMVIQYHNSFETIIRLAELGMGLTFLPETYIAKNSKLDYFFIGFNGERRSLALGFPPNGYVSKATRIFADLVIETVRNQKLVQIVQPCNNC